MEALRYALEHNNEYILPCLSWTMLILGQAERMQQLADFLEASCAVIDEHQSMGRGFTYAIPFRYAWAWARNNEQEMNSFGDRLEHCYNQIRIIWGEEHPNFFVSGYLYAWNLLRRGDNAKAIKLLTNSLPVCEKEMGRHDLLTINCLAVISRAHGEMRHWVEAIHYLRKAMAAIQLLEADEDHAHFHRPILQRFRLSLLGRHADLKFHLQDYTGAEKQFWRAFHLCSQLYGLENVDTWNAANGLGSVLQMTGKEAVWKDLEDYLYKAWAWEHTRKWCRENGKEAPPPPPAPPCLWPFEDQEETNVGS
jgi:tetratricopeptide (TPR) repeat protein